MVVGWFIMVREVRAVWETRLGAHCCCLDGCCWCDDECQWRRRSDKRGEIQMVIADQIKGAVLTCDPIGCDS